MAPTTTELDRPCNSDPCLNGGDCIHYNQYTEFACLCQLEFTGVFCEISVPCKPNPCQNQGKCTQSDDYSFYTCDCTQGFTGTNCENPDSRRAAALSIPLHNCQNGGRPTFNSDNTYSCTCQINFTGNDCHIEMPCADDSICGDGRCINSEDYVSHTCACKRGYTGAYCNVSIPCNGNPCSRHGYCQNLPDFTSYVCVCNAGWTGRDCSSSLRATRRSQSKQRSNAGQGDRRRFV